MRNSMWRRLLNNGRAWTALMTVVLVVGAFWICWGRVPQADRTGDDEAAEMGPRPGFQASDFELASLEGEPIRLSELEGKIIILNFWATWCQPCRTEMPALERVWNQYRERDLIILAVNLQESPQRVSAFVQEIGLTFPILLDDDGQVFQQYQVQLYPTTYFIDRGGIIRDVIYGGPMAETTVASKVIELLED